MAKSDLAAIQGVGRKFTPLAPNQTLVIRAGRVLTGLPASDRVRRDQAIVDDDALIAALTDWARYGVPAGVEVVGAGAATVMPGLIEALCDLVVVDGDPSAGIGVLCAPERIARVIRSNWQALPSAVEDRR